MADHKSLLNYSFSRLALDRGLEDLLESRRLVLPEAWGGHCGATAQEMAARYLASTGQLEVMPGDGVDTHASLCRVIGWFAGQEAEPRGWSHTLDRLQKRFELTKRVHESYDAGIIREAGSGSAAVTYSALSMALLLRFVSDGSYNDLNSALKLNDLLLKSESLAGTLHAERDLWPLLCELDIVARLCGEART